MKTIQLGGKERPVHYGINALADFNRATGTDFEWIFKVASKPMSVDFDQARWLVFVGLKAGAEEIGEKVDFTLRDVGNWLDKDFRNFPDFIQAMNESFPVMEGGEKN